MNFKFLYWLGTLILFLGLMWMFLPHTAHNEVLEDVGAYEEGEEGESHFTHTLQGGVGTIIGLFLVAYSNKNLKRKKH